MASTLLDEWILRELSVKALWFLLAQVSKSHAELTIMGPNLTGNVLYYQESKALLLVRLLDLGVFSGWYIHSHGLAPSRSQYCMVDRCWLYITNLFAEVSKSICKLSDLHSVFWFSHWLMLILGKPPNVLYFRCEVLAGILRWVFTLQVCWDKPWLCSVPICVPRERPSARGGRAALQVKELWWGKWNRGHCVPLPTSNTEVLIWSTGKLFECAVRYLFVLNANWLCHHCLMKTARDKLSGKILCSLP